MTHARLEKLPALAFSLDLALSGKGAVPRADYDKALADAEPGAGLAARTARQSLELLGIPSRTDDLKAAAKAAASIKGMKTVAVLGIGGSSLGGQALTALRRSASPIVEFHDNPDPFSWDAALKRFDLKKTHFIAISKSGGTAETLMQVLTAAEALKKAGVKSLKKHFTIITEPQKSALADFADGIGAARLDHPTGVGGRYSVLTVVGVLPAILMGIDVKKLARRRASGAGARRLAAKSAGRCAGCYGRGAASGAGGGGQARHHHSLALCRQAGGVRRLVAAALGRKPGQGRQGLDAGFGAGAGGPAQPVATVPRRAGQCAVHHGDAWTPRAKARRRRKPRAKSLGLDYLAGKKLGDLVDAESRATAQTLFKNGRPVRADPSSPRWMNSTWAR